MPDGARPAEAPPARWTVAVMAALVAANVLLFMLIA